MTKTIAANEMLALIDINPPYFAFEEITQENDLLFANVPVQQPLGNELGPISAAEASRHLAILGVCSCALANPVQKRHYYLAYKGIYERVETYSGEPSSKPLTGKAKCISVDRKKAEAITEIMDQNGDTIIRLHVFYHVILDTTFERLYKDHYVETPDFKYANPYKIKHPFKNEHFEAAQMTASMGAVPEFMCAGHFPHYPALPVAILVYNLFDMASRLTAHMENDAHTKTLIRQYEINADNLAFAGDSVALQVTNHGTKGDGGHEISAEGISNGTKSVGRIQMVLETCKQEQAVSVLAVK